MNALESSILTYLLNSTWQVPLIFFAAWLLARATKRAGPAIEHRLWVTALALQVLLPACTFSPTELLRKLSQLLSWLPNEDAANSHTQVTAFTGAGTGQGVLLLPPHLLTAAAVAYLVSIVYFAGRLAWGLWSTHLLLRRCRPASFTYSILQSWNRACTLFNVHDAQVFTSDDLAGPVTVGIRQRIVLLPPNLQTAFSGEDLNAALAHEFAHMRRRDFAKNLLYELLALPAAYHPFLWLARARIAETREMVCDALAAKALAGPERYARSLLRLAALLIQRPPAKTLHAIGIFDAHTFERRLMNLTQKHVQVKGLRRLAIAGACIVAGSATCASALALHIKIVMPTQGAAIQTSDVTTPAKISSGVMAGNRVSYVQPVYPQSAKDAKIAGTVLLRAVIGKDGNIASLKLISGPPELTESAWTAVKQWTYKPYLLNGEPTEVETTITVNYSLAPQPE